MQGDIAEADRSQTLTHTTAVGQCPRLASLALSCKGANADTYKGSHADTYKGLTR